MQMDCEGETVITGNGSTISVTIVEFVHPLLFVPVTVYVDVVVGNAVTEEPVVELSPVAGDQE